jgi:hypothetical protein
LKRMGLWDEEMELDEAERMMGWQQELERRQR